MARAARTASVIVALLGALAIAPAIASAGIAGSTAVSLPSAVTVGQTVTATITITNLNEPPNDEDPNTLCAFEPGTPCVGQGTTLVPSCGGVVMALFCGPGEQDPGVFSAAPVATGPPGSVCADKLFDVTVANPDTGELHITPRETITLPLAGSTCVIAVSLTVVAMPGRDAAPETDGTQTAQIASSTQASASPVTSVGISQTTVTAQPAIATSASRDVMLGAGAITDAATVSGRVSPVPGATVAFDLYGLGDTTCAAPISTTAAPVGADGVATSPPVTPARVGTYRWIAAYSGDANNAPVAGACNDPGESVAVRAAAPRIVATTSAGGRVGVTVTDTASVAGRVSPVSGSTVRFALFGPDDVACLTAIFSATVPVGDTGLATSPAVAPPVAGTYRWTASYSGDANNAATSTACGEPSQVVAVTPLPPDVLSAGFASTPRVGQQAVLTIAAFDPTRPIAGVQVQFGEPRGLSGISACHLGAFGVTVSPVRLRLPYVFRRAGRHRIVIVVLSGGCDAKLTATRTTIEVFVASGRSARVVSARAAGRSAEPVARAAQSACKNALLRPTSSVGSRLKVATAILCLVNVARGKLGLRKLKRSKVLTIAAAGHSKDMLKRRFFEHAGPGGPSFGVRLRRIRYRGGSAAENIAYGSSFDARLVMRAWMNSPPHKANILSPRARFLGTAIAVGIPVVPGRPGSTYTQDFGSTLK
jgi:uncharacterized protein YkwD